MENRLRSVIKEEVMETLSFEGNRANDEQLERIIDGVEYWIMDGLQGSIATAIHTELEDIK